MIKTFINLQLFAAANTNTTATLSIENKIFYDRNLIEEASPYLIHDQWADKKPIPKNGGTKIEFRKFANLPKATTPLTEGVTPDGKSLTVTKIEAEVKQYGDYVTLSDVLDLTAIDPVVLESTNIVSRQAGCTLDTVTRNVMQSGTNVFYCPKDDGTEVTERSQLDDTCLLTVDVVSKVVAKLRAQNAPTFNGDYIGIIHPYVAYTLMKDPAWLDAHKYTTPENIFKGEVGKIAGVRFVTTSEAKIYYTGIFGSLIFGAHAYGTTEVEGGGMELIVKQKGSAGSADPLDQRSTVGWKALKTAEILVDNYLCRVESMAPGFGADEN